MTPSPPHEEGKPAMCAICGKPATCLGLYDAPYLEADLTTPDEYACDDCCGHGNEDGYCEPVMREEP